MKKMTMTLVLSAVLTCGSLFGAVQQTAWISLMGHSGIGEQGMLKYTWDDLKQSEYLSITCASAEYKCYKIDNPAKYNMLVKHIEDHILALKNHHSSTGGVSKHPKQFIRLKYDDDAIYSGDIKYNQIKSLKFSIDSTYPLTY